jgi:hypothetical protein
MFPSAIIKKKKKDEVPFESINMGGLPVMKAKSAGEMPVMKAKDFKSPEFEGIDMEKLKSPEFKGIDMEKLKSPEFKGIDMEKLKSPDASDMLKLELKLKDAKKKPSGETEYNAVSEDGEKFEVEKDSKGMWKESGVSKEKYLRAIGKLKKK